MIPQTWEEVRNLIIEHKSALIFVVIFIITMAGILTVYRLTHPAPIVYTAGYVTIR